MSRPARRTALVFAATIATAVAMVGAAPSMAAADPGQRTSSVTAVATGAAARVVGVGGPGRMILRSGCRETYRAAAVFDAQAGEDYFAVINAEDGTGRGIIGATREGTVTKSGRITLWAPLLLCGSSHDAGTGTIKVGLIVGDTNVTLRKRVRIAYADKVGLSKPAKRVRKGKKVRFHGRWSRGKGFNRGLTTYVRKSVKVRVFFKPHGKKWRRVATTRIDTQGRWSKRIKVRSAGKWQARVLETTRLLPAKSKTYKVRVKR